MSELNKDATAPRRRSGCFTFVFLTLLAVLIIGGIVAWKVVDSGFGLKWIAAHFQQQTISEAFRENVKRISSTNGDVLELATLDMEEAITRFDTKTLFDTIYLGTTESEIRAMVVYRYHLKLSDDWKLHVENGRCVVIAPAIRPSLPPAIRTDTVERKSEAGWMRFNAAQNLVDLEKGMTSILERRAAGPSKIRHVRDAARQSVAQFVRKWALNGHKHQPEGEIQDIVVIFPDEAAAQDPGEARKQPATLRLDAAQP